MPRRACLAIGVSTVKTPEDGTIRFKSLDGAIVAAQTIGSWARATGFGDANVEVVTDRVEDGDVTPARVQAAIDRLFAAGTEKVDHMLLSYCGHGVTGAEVNSTFWLFSDALTEEYRVHVDNFLIELLNFGVERITLISDACREGPKTLDLLRFEARRAIKGRGAPVKDPKMDRMAACQDGDQAFMVRRSNSALPGKCIFSGVVVDTLCKHEAAAIADGVITTTSLGMTARSRATERAKGYKLDLFPQCYVDPLPATLLAAGQDVPEDFPLQIWPVVAQGQTMGDLPIAPEDVVADLPSPETVLGRARSDLDFQKSVLGEDFGKTALDLDVSRNLSSLPGVAAGSLFNLVLLHTMAAGVVGTARGAFTQRIERSVRQVEAEAAGAARAEVAAKFISHIGEYRKVRAPSWSLIGLGVEVRQIWGAPGARCVRLDDLKEGGKPSHVWQFPDDGDAPVLVETAEGLFIPVTPYEDLFAVLIPDPRGGSVLAYGSSYGENRLDDALRAIADLSSGELEPGKIDAMTAELRIGKHVDPVRGVISAYLYRAVADLDNIRRMAYFYHAHDQAVPFDIALLGDMAVAEVDGILSLSVPAVAARTDDRAGLPEYAMQATRAVTARIGGHLPWLSIGWDYVADPFEGAEPLVKDLRPLANTVARSGFTNLTAETGLVVATRFGLQPFPGVIV